MANVIKSTKNGSTGLWTVIVAVGGAAIPVVGYLFEGKSRRRLIFYPRTRRQSGRAGFAQLQHCDLR